MYPIFNTVTNAFCTFHEDCKQKTLHNDDLLSVLALAGIPIYGPILLNYKLNTIKAQIDSPEPVFNNKAKLIADYTDTAYLLVASCAIQALFLSIIPAAILSSQIFFMGAQFAVSIAVLYTINKIEKQIETYQSQYFIEVT